MITLTATDLPRFMACNGYRLMPHHKPFNVDDTARDEGNAAHWLIEQVHRGISTLEQLEGEKAFNGVFITEEMIEYVKPYLEAVTGKGEVECDTSYSDGQRYSIRGRADHVSQSGDTLYVSDFKYGWGLVEPERNWTLISHAFGYAFTKLNGVFPAQVVMRIYQPRPHHPEGKIREWRVTGTELQALYEEFIRVMHNPSEELHTSEHCRKCPALLTCPAAQKSGMNAIDTSEAAFVADIDDGSLGRLLDQIDRAIKVLEQNKKAYTEHALHRLKAGAVIPNYVAERELTNRQWKDGVNVEFAKLVTGVDLGKSALITPAQALKKGVSEAAIESLCERREKGIKLVRLDADKAVKKMFNNLKGA